MFNFFKRKKTPDFYNFSTEHESEEATTLNSETKLSIDRIHEDVKLRMIEHQSFLIQEFGDYNRIDNSFLEKSCLELASLYYDIFSLKFAENKIPSVTGKYFFFPFLNNFITLESLLKSEGFDSMFDFFKTRMISVHDKRDLQLESIYQCSNFFLRPLIKTESPDIRMYDVLHMMNGHEYYVNLKKALIKQADKLIDELRVYRVLEIFMTDDDFFDSDDIIPVLSLIHI